MNLIREIIATNWRGKLFTTAALAFLLCLTGLAVTGTAHADFDCDVCLWVVTKSRSHGTL